MTPSQGTEPTADPCLCFQNQLILGVMGIDVALNDIKRLTSTTQEKECSSSLSPCSPSLVDEARLSSGRWGLPQPVESSEFRQLWEGFQRR